MIEIFHYSELLNDLEFGFVDATSYWELRDTERSILLVRDGVECGDHPCALEMGPRIIKSSSQI